jgi:YesN/AraC family two-component response regulator
MPTEDEQQLRVMLARIEGKLDLLASQHRRQADDLEDHERRIREVETTLHGLASLEDIEQIEQKRDRQQADRQRRTMTWVGVLISLIVPIEAAIVALIIQAVNS